MQSKPVSKHVSKPVPLVVFRKPIRKPKTCDKHVCDKNSGLNKDKKDDFTLNDNSEEESLLKVKTKKYFSKYVFVFAILTLVYECLI